MPTTLENDQLGAGVKVGQRAPLVRGPGPTRAPPPTRRDVLAAGEEAQEAVTRQATLSFLISRYFFSKFSSC